ncbi:MAG: hypothetical protein U0931_19180 [Vulcanimicrobiota bacterium]
MKYLPRIQAQESLPDGVHTQPLVGNLRVTFWGEDSTPLSQAGFEALASDPKTLLEASVENLDRRLTTLTGQEVSGLKFGLESDRPVFTSLKVGQELEACLLLLPHVWDQLAQRVSGELVVGVPGTDRIMFTSSDHFEGQLAMRKLLEAAYEHAGPRALSQDLLVWRQGAWQLFTD